MTGTIMSGRVVSRQPNIMPQCKKSNCSKGALRSRVCSTGGFPRLGYILSDIADLLCVSLCSVCNCNDNWGSGGGPDIN